MARRTVVSDVALACAFGRSEAGGCTTAPKFTAVAAISTERTDGILVLHRKRIHPVNVTTNARIKRSE